jgi:stress response protein YsnF
MLEDDQITQVPGREVYGPDGDKIGKAGRVFVDDQTGRPKWVSVETGLFGAHDTFIPVDGATFDGDQLTVPFAKGQVKGAPSVGGGDHLSPEDEATLDGYYRGQGSGVAASAGSRLDDRDRRAEDDRDRTSRGEDRVDADDRGRGDDDAMTVSEEQLAVSTRSVATERVRLRKQVVTEEVTLTVTLRKERLTIEREPIGEDEVGDHVGSTDFAGGDQEIVLYEEVPVVQTVVRPVERIRLGTEVTTEQQTVGGEVRKERVELDQPEDLTGRGEDRGRIG